MLIDGKTKLLGLVGENIGHSLSARMQNRALENLGENYLYLPLDIKRENFSTAIEGLKALGFKGFNVTTPYKEDILGHLDSLTEEARAIGAVNTVFLKDGDYIGDNTDGLGFKKALQEQFAFEFSEKKILIFGAGGAAKALALTLSLAGILDFVIVNRDLSKALSLAERIRLLSSSRAEAISLDAESLPEKIRASDLIVNATSLGMSPKIDECLNIDYSAFREGQLVVDLIYKPEKTKFLEKAEKNGARIANGEAMLLYQGVLSLERWLEKAAPEEIMREELRQAINSQIEEGL